MEVLSLDSLIHIHGMCFHGSQLPDFTLMVQEHSANYLTQDFLGSTGDTCIIKQVALLIFRLGVDIVWQPAYQRVLVKATQGFQQLDTSQHSTKLVLPATTCGQQLLQHQCALSYLVLVPCQ